MLFEILGEFLLTFHRATTCIWSEDHGGARKKVRSLPPNIVTLRARNPSAVHTTDSLYEWTRPDVYVPLESVAYSPLTATSTTPPERRRRGREARLITRRLWPLRARIHRQCIPPASNINRLGRTSMCRRSR